MSLLDILGRIGHGAGGVLEGAGRGVLGGLEDVGRGLIGQQQQGRPFGMTPEQLQQFIPDEGIRTAVLNMMIPRTQDLLGPIGKIPVLGPVLGGTLDVLSTIQAARHGGLGRELGARAAGGALGFQNLEHIAGARSEMERFSNLQKQGGVITKQGDEITDRIRRNNETTDARIRFIESQRITQDAATETQKAAAKAHEAQAWADYQRGIAAGRYPGELPPGTDPSTIRVINGKPVVDTPRGPMVLPNAPAPGKPGEVKPPPMGAMTKEQAQAKVAAYPPEARAQMRELPGRPGLFTVETVPIDAGGERRRVVGLEALEKMMPGALPFSGEDFRDPTTREKGNAILQQITGRPHDIGQLLDESGRLDREKLGKFLQEQKDMDAARDALIY